MAHIVDAQTGEVLVPSPPRDGAPDTGGTSSTTEVVSLSDVDSTAARALSSEEPAAAHSASEAHPAAAPAKPSLALPLSWQRLSGWVGSLLDHAERAKLTALLDRYQQWSQVLVITLLVFLTAWLAFEISQFYYDIGQVALWVVVAGAQYSLIKSVQPDSASASVDARSTAFSRAAYFVAFASLALLLDLVAEASPWTDLRFYGIPLHSPPVFRVLRNITLVVIVCFPAIFAAGVFPVIRTAFHHALEQVDMHLFGGSGTSTAGLAVARLLHCVACVAALYGLAMGAMNRSVPNGSSWFALFCGLAMGVGFWTARMPTDTPWVLWRCLRRMRWHKCKSGSNRTDDENQGETSAPATTPSEAATRVESPSEGESAGKSSGVVSLEHGPVAPATAAASAARKSRDAAPADEGSSHEEQLLRTQTRLVRLAWDTVGALAVFVVWMAVMFTGFVTLSPLVLVRAMAICVAVLGVALEYILPQMRAPHPWKLGRGPVIGPADAQGIGARPPTGPRPWYERLTHFLSWLLRGVLLPLLILAAASASVESLRAKWGHHGAAALLAVATFKLARACRGPLVLLYLALPTTLLFFAYDYGRWSETVIVDLAVGMVVAHKVCELMLKIRFVMTYNAPWHVKDVWGSTAHAILYPLAIPHTAVTFVQACISTALSAPLYPLMGSAIFLVSYARPIKFWERGYLTAEDDRQLRLKDALNNPPLANTLNALFYKHVLVRFGGREQGARNEKKRKGKEGGPGAGERNRGAGGYRNTNGCGGGGSGNVCGRWRLAFC